MSIQVTGTILDGCVLSLIAKEDTYGYSLTQQVKSILGVSESTLYPVMRRLQTEGCLDVYDVSHNGRNRRYYEITSTGWAKYRECIRQWEEFSQRVNNVIQEGKPYD